MARSVDGWSSQLPSSSGRSSGAAVEGWRMLKGQRLFLPSSLQQRRRNEKERKKKRNPKSGCEAGGGFWLQSSVRRLSAQTAEPKAALPLLRLARRVMLFKRPPCRQEDEPSSSEKGSASAAVNKDKKIKITSR